MKDKKKEWFDWYCEQANKDKTYLKFRDKFICPCCKLPTLDSRPDYEICTICWWEDGGQDDDEAEIIRGGPNGKYSLAMARHNFIKYGIMYPPDDPHIKDIDHKIEASKRVIDQFKKAAETRSIEDWNKAINLYNGL